MARVKPIRKEKKLRIMLNSNAVWSPSGYGQQAAQFVPKMVAEGYEVACVDFYGLQGGIMHLDGVWHYPVMNHSWGEDAMINHAKHFKPDVVFTLQDIWVLNPQALTELSKISKWIPIVPIDHEPVPDPIFNRLKLAYRVVTYAPFGERELKNKGMHSTYIPHTVPTDIMKKHDKAKMKKVLGLDEDTFLFGMVAANKDNPPRKSFQEVMEAFAKFHKKHPKSALYMHTVIKTDKGFPIDMFAKKLGIEEAILHPDIYELQYLINQEQMGKIYSSFDCLLAPSLNEGFGVPLIEAQTCGVPVITNDYTAMRDLVKDGFNGYKTRVAYERFDSLQSYIGIPDVDHLYELMEKMWDHREDGTIEQMGENGMKFVKENFDLELVWNRHWKPFLEKLEKEIHDN